MRYKNVDIDVLVFAQLRVDNTASLRVSRKTPATTQQWVITSSKGPDVAPIKEHLTFLEFLDENQEDQLDIFADDTHEKTMMKYEASTGPKIVLDLAPKATPRRKRNPSKSISKNRKNNAKTVDDVLEFDLGSDADSEVDYDECSTLSVSMRYKSEETNEYCVLVLAITVNSRYDKYCLVVKTKTILFQNIMLLYRRGFFGKLLNLISREAKMRSRLSHLLNINKIPQHCAAVCITQPSIGDCVDTSFRIGNVYDMYGYDTNMAGDEFLIIDRDGEEVSRHSRHFMIFNR